MQQRTAVPGGVTTAAAWSWRLLVISAAISLLVALIVTMRLLVIPLLVSVIVSALLVPFRNYLQRHRVPRWASIAIALLAAIGVVITLIYLIVTQVNAGLADLKAQSVDAYEKLLDALSTGPLALSPADVSDIVNTGLQALQENSQALLSGLASIGASLGHLLTGIALVIFTTLFILIDGARIWRWIVHLFPRHARLALETAGASGWSTLQSYVTVQIFVATVDAVGIGLGAALLGVPLAVPIAVLVFLGSFIPIVGALVSGAAAVFIALVFNGWGVAVAMLAVVLFVQQVESHLLQPLVMGRAVRVHPLAVVFAVTGGAMLAGIAGAFFAVPVVAALNSMILTIVRGDWRRSGSALSIEKAPPR